MNYLSISDQLSISQRELDFLAKHNISTNEIYNAFGLCVSDCVFEMELLNKIFAFNTSPCAKASHKLRSRSGHCIQCDPSRITFQRRANDPGIVYIAASTKAQRIKIGYTKNNFHRRELSLNSSKYAGITDWKIICAVFSSKAGKIELLVKEDLKKYSINASYFHDSHQQMASEIFSCSYVKANEHLMRFILTDQSTNVLLNTPKIEKYNFRNLTRTNFANERQAS